jgi:hypothetical protein
MIIVHVNTSLVRIFSNTSLASSLLPHFAYMLRRRLPRWGSGSRPASAKKPWARNPSLRDLPLPQSWKRGMKMEDEGALFDEEGGAPGTRSGELFVFFLQRGGTRGHPEL